MTYQVKYINCKICGSDNPKFLGLRGNIEFWGASDKTPPEEHMVTNVVKCRECGFVYTNPFIIVDAQDRYSQPQEYNPSADNIHPSELFNFNLSLIERYTGKGRLLDIGCGKGEFLAVAKEAGWQTWGLELSSGFADYARRKYGLNIQTREIRDAELPEGFFDVITLNMALEHIDEPHRLMQEIHRVLKKRGLIFIEVPDMDSLMLNLIRFYYIFQGKNWSPLLSPLHYPYHTYGYNRRSLMKLFLINGFQIKKFFSFGIGLRGFRPQIKLKRLPQVCLNSFSQLASYLGRGDVLIALGEKR